MNNEVNAQSDGHLYIVSPRGYSAYEIAVQNGFEGTEEEWLASLKGDTGETGAQGPQGKSAYQVAVDNRFEGTEEDFVNSYLNADNYYNKDEVDKRITHVFGVVNDMIHADLKAGNIVATMGYHNLSDGGGGLYMIISTDVYLIVDNGLLFHLDNGLYAKLITRGAVNVKQLGAYGDGTHDDTNVLQNAFDKIKNVFIPKGRYKITNTIKITEGSNVSGEGMFLSSLVYYGTGKAVEISNNYYGITNIKKISILKNGGYVEGDTTSIGLNISSGVNNRNVTNLYMDNVVIRYFGINFNCSVAGLLLNSNFTNCLFEGGYNNCNILGGYNNYFDKCRFGEAAHYGYFQQSGEGRFINCSFEGNFRAVRLANSGGSYSFINCFIENTDNSSTGNKNGITIEAGSLASIDNISIINCHFYGCYRQVYLEKVKKVTFINNTMFNPGLQCVGYAYTDPDIESIVYMNNNFAIKPYAKSTFVKIIDDDLDTRWVTINTSSSTRGSYYNFQMRKIGKLVKWRGYMNNITDSDKNNLLGITIPEEFRPKNNVSCSCPMSQGNNDNYIQNAGLTINSSGSIKLEGYNTTSDLQNKISFDTISYFVE